MREQARGARALHEGPERVRGPGPACGMGKCERASGQGRQAFGRGRGLKAHVGRACRDMRHWGGGGGGDYPVRGGGVVADVVVPGISYRTR